MIAPRAAAVTGLLAMLGGCVDYGGLGYSAVPVAGAPPYGPGNTPSLDQFTAALAPFGRWLQSPQWGNVWQPQVGPGWQPYTVGRWLDDPRYGRTWLGDEPWSWATDHYGRWGYDRQLGWIWVPGTQWAPAWVAWRDGSDTAGWAPLPPLIGYGAALGAFAYDSWGYDQWYAPSWVFVPRGAVYAPYRQRPRLPYARDRDDWNATRPAKPGPHGGQYGGQHGAPHGGQHGGQQGSIDRDGNAYVAPPRRGSGAGGTGARPGTPGDSAGANAAPSRPARGTAGQGGGGSAGGRNAEGSVVVAQPPAAPPAPRPAPAPAAEAAAPAPRPGPGHELSPRQPE